MMRTTPHYSLAIKQANQAMAQINLAHNLQSQARTNLQLVRQTDDFLVAPPDIQVDKLEADQFKLAAKNDLTKALAKLRQWKAQPK